MPIPFDGREPLVHVFGLYQIPASLADCIDQYRLDRLQAATEDLAITEELQSFLSPEPDSAHSHIAGLFDPLTYYGYTAPQYAAPGTVADLPESPYVLASRSSVVYRLLWPFTSRMEEKLRRATDTDLSRLTKLVASGFLSNPPAFGSRDEMVRYLAFSNADNPGAEELRWQPDLWRSCMRSVTLPDMVAQRQLDFQELFERVGKPLRPEELSCIPHDTLLEYASDMRAYILEQNRHAVLCQRCSAALLQMNAQVMTPPEHWIT